MKSHAIAFLAACVVALGVTPASAMHWMIYAPDEDGYRYWIDNDSIQVKGDYTFVTYLLGAADSLAPTATTGGRTVGIDCKTGDSVFEENGQTAPGPHFSEAAYLYKWLCEKK